ncbi:hypothetical protein OAT16_04295 [Prolixibacteraceae bacterium]|nr:hypothetical protein [Prolixibacteraceae bacterium]
MRKIIFLYVAVILMISCSKEELPGYTKAVAIENEILQTIRDYHVKEIYVKDYQTLFNSRNHFTKDFEVGGGMIRVDEKWYSLKNVKELRLSPGNSSQGLIIVLPFPHKFR